MEILEQIRLVFMDNLILNTIDILIVYFLLYYAYRLIDQMRGKQLIKGIAVFVIIAQLSKFFQLYTLSWILNSTLQLGFIALIIIFQPELRKALEFLGNSAILTSPDEDLEKEAATKIVDSVFSAVSSLARQKIGALIVFERKTGLKDIADTGVRLDSEISSGLLINIFIPNTPLHDGAVLIRKDKVVSAGCFLPLTDNNTLSKETGTRHRAALGMAEKSDAVVVIVSEETGYISYAKAGRLYRNISSDDFEKLLTRLYISENKTRRHFSWGAKNEK